MANHPFITSGHTLTVAQLAAGEFDATPTAYGYMVELQRRQGHSVDFITPKPAIVGLVPVGLVQGAPHPNAARVLLDWLLSREGQQYCVDVSGRTSARTDVRNDTRVFDARRPFYVIPTPDRTEYKTLTTQFKQLLGMNQ
jgi:iron(III) transport system substrate-binding protein